MLATARYEIGSLTIHHGLNHSPDFSTYLVVIPTITVLRKSNAASTRDAKTETELLRTTTMIFKISRRVFATTLIQIATVTTGDCEDASSSYSRSGTVGPDSRSSTNRRVLAEAQGHDMVAWLAPGS